MSSPTSTDASGAPVLQPAGAPGGDPQPQDLRPVLARLARGDVLSEAEAEAAFGIVMSGAASEAQIGGLLMALRVRGETPGELAGAARAMRARMITVEAPPGTIDVCGTGGDRHGTFNISTAVAILLAALGVPVAKHGNRAQSSPSGAVDVLAALGVPLPVEPALLSRQLAETGLAFLVAPAHHPAMRHAGPVRSQLGTRTLFNLLGPLCNPACVRLQLVGVFDRAWLEPVAATLGRLGSERAWVVHGTIDEPAQDSAGQGLDELSLAGPGEVVALEAGVLHRFTLTAEMAGLSPAPLAAIRGGDPARNAEALRSLFSGNVSNGLRAYRDTVLLNAAAALCIARGGNIFAPDPLARALRAAAGEAARALDDGSAGRFLERLQGPLPA